jgi:hypothetical protein
VKRASLFAGYCFKPWELTIDDLTFVAAFGGIEACVEGLVTYGFNEPLVAITLPPEASISPVYILTIFSTWRFYYRQNLVHKHKHFTNLLLQ